MTDHELQRRQILGAVGAVGLLLVAATPRLAWAQAPAWEFFIPQPREFSRIRRVVPPTMAVEFGGRRVDPGAGWPKLSEDERAAVRAIQPAPLPADDEPVYPRVGLKPLIERLRVVRGPVGQPLRVYVQIDQYGAPEQIAIDGPVSKQFTHEMLGLLRDAAFKPGTCGGKACTRVFAMDLVYLGEEG
ncbi:MAG: hypothetical protein IV093_05505 [Rubrivivax sp.]|nr:hypothetical protein [Rubrivivax sp.]